VTILLRQAKLQGWQRAEDLEDITEEELVALLSGSSGRQGKRDQSYKFPDYEYVHWEAGQPYLPKRLTCLPPWPKQGYELATWRTATVQPNYHVAVHKMFYSVPFQYISKKLQVKTTRSMVEIYDGDTRICSHLRLEGRSGQYRTRPEHMPDKHQKYLQWDEKRFMNWAAQYGPSTEAVIRALLASHAIPQHGFRGCLAILKLPGKHTREPSWNKLARRH